MEFFESVKKALLAGIGVPEKLREVIDELVSKGELSESQGASLIKEWTEKAEQGSSEIQKTVTDAVTKALEKIPLTRKEDLESLRKDVESLAERLKALEEKSA